MQTKDETALKEVKIEGFIKALTELKNIGKEKRYTDIKIDKWFKKDGSINDELEKEDKKTMCKYLLYLFAGALAEDVHIATGNTRHKGLKRKIKDMKDGEFGDLLSKLADKDDKKTKLMNETGAYKWESIPVPIFFGLGRNAGTPSHKFNNGIKKVAIIMKGFLNLKQTDLNPQQTNLNKQPTNLSKQLTNDEFIEKFLDIFNKTRTEIQEAGENLRRCCIKRPIVNIARCFKRLLGKQDFSHVNSKYKKVFEPLNLEDANKDNLLQNKI